MATTAADLEIALRRLDGQRAAVELRFSAPGSDSDVRLCEESAVEFELDKLEELTYDPEEYGSLLGRCLLAGELANAFGRARQEAESAGAVLRVRLFVAPTAERLHGLRWETLRDPSTGATLLTNQNVLFSRYLSSLDWRPVGVTPKAELDAVVVVANPTGLDQWQPDGQALAPVDVEGELARARAGLGTMPSVELAKPGEATLDRIIGSLDNGAEVLYLACHGFLAGGEPQILLEDDNGAAERVGGTELIRRLSEVTSLPRLVVLASCQSAGTGDATSADQGALAGLGPRLAEIGVPAVVAMQGNVSMDTVAAFIPAFFAELDRDGQIDRAMAVARAAVRERPDWWMPVLYMRLKSGRLWYVPGFGAGAGFERWPALTTNIRRGRCLPILGPGVTDALLGPRQHIARLWAERFRFPMAPHHQDALADVAQFLSATQDPQMPMDELCEYLHLEIDRYRAELPADLQQVAQASPVAAADLEKLVRALWDVRRRAQPAEPHSVLAALPFDIFVTTQPVGVLCAALEAAGKAPQVDYCRWKGPGVEWPPSPWESDPAYKPSVESPLVYHLFGHLGIERSVVLTADSYVDFLIGLTANTKALPSDVKRALAQRALLFFGFRVDELDFRVLFRIVMSLEGRSDSFRHVAAQIDPEGMETVSPEGARHYIESYLQDAKVDVFWGSTERFVQDLNTQWQTGPQG